MSGQLLRSIVDIRSCEPKLRLKRMVDGHFKGLASKYLNNYVSWYGFLHAHKKDIDEVEELLYRIAITAVCSKSNRAMSQRDAVPILSEKQRGMLDWLLLRIAQSELEERKRKLQKVIKQAADENATCPIDQGEDDDLPF